LLDDLNLRALQELPSLDEIGVLLEQESTVPEAPKISVVATVTE